VISQLSRDSQGPQKRDAKAIRLLQRGNAKYSNQEDKLLLRASPPIFVSGSSEVPNSA